MAELTTPKEIDIRGKVIEIYSKEGNQFIKLSADNCYLEFIVNPNIDIHLGDELCFTGNFTVEKVNQIIHNHIN